MTLPKEDQRWPGLSGNHGFADETFLTTLNGIKIPSFSNVDWHQNYFMCKRKENH
jgi:hypothetical protein